MFVILLMRIDTLFGLRNPWLSLFSVIQVGCNLAEIIVLVGAAIISSRVLGLRCSRYAKLVPSGVVTFFGLRPGVSGTGEDFGLLKWNLVPIPSLKDKLRFAVN